MWKRWRGGILGARRGGDGGGGGADHSFLAAANVSQLPGRGPREAGDAADGSQRPAKSAIFWPYPCALRAPVGESKRKA